MIDQPELGQRMLADRKARKMSRDKYAEMLGDGFTAAKVANLEGGRKVKASEAEQISHLAFATADASGAEAVQPADDGVPGEAVPAGDGGGFFERDQVVMLAEYAEVYALLGGKPSPIPYLPQWGAPHEITDPHMQQRVRRWCVEVKERLGVLTPDAPPPPPPPPLADAEPDANTGPDATIIDFPVPEVDEDDDTDLAIVTDETWTSFPNDGIARYSNGQLRTFKRCKRKFWLAYYRRLGLPMHRVTGAAPLGTRFHRCVAVLYVPDGQVRGDPLAELDRTLKEDLVKVAGDEFKTADLIKEVELCRAMLEGYVEWLQESGADQGLEIIAPEAMIEVDAQIPGVVAHLIAKLDVRARRTLGNDVAQVFIDHKTVGDLTSPLKMLHMDEQMLHYHLLEFLDLVQSGADPNVRTDGALYNMARKVKRTAAAKPPFYDRTEVRHNVETLRSYWMRVKGTILDIIELEKKLNDGADPREVAYPNPTKDCSWDCDFFHICPMFDDGSRVEDYIAENMVTVNPLERYEPQNLGHTL